MKPTREGLTRDGKFLLVQLILILGVVALCDLLADSSPDTHQQSAAAETRR